MRRKMVTLIAAAILAFASGGTALAAADAGQVLALAGQCFVDSGGQRGLLKSGDTVHVGDVIEVADGAKLKLRMADGSVISVAAGSRMTIQAYDVDGSGQRRDARLGLASGLLRAVVTAVDRPSHFEVATATGVAAARSTDWFVEARPGATRVGVLVGLVSVTGRNAANPVMVPARSGTTVDVGRAPQPARVWTAAEFAELIARTSVSSGWCQCIDDRAAIRAICQPSVDACQALCGGSHYAFVPDATQTCASGSGL